MYIKNTKTTNPTPLHTKRVETKRKRTKQASERSQGQVRATTRTMLRDIFYFPALFFSIFPFPFDDEEREKSKI